MVQVTRPSPSSRLAGLSDRFRLSIRYPLTDWLKHRLNHGYLTFKNRLIPQGSSGSFLFGGTPNNPRISPIKSKILSNKTAFMFLAKKDKTFFYFPEKRYRAKPQLI